MDQLLKLKGESGDSMVANLGEEEQTQKGKEVGDQQKEQQTEAEATEEDDQEDNHEEEDATERLKSIPKEMKQLQHFSHPEHPLVFNEDRIYGGDCYGCGEPILGPSYSCKECNRYRHHKSCAELPLGLLHHPLHPLHPLLLFAPWIDSDDSDDSDDEANSEVFKDCQVCKENRWEYCYGCFRCNFKLHIRCGSLPLTMEAAAEVHEHPLTAIWKQMTFTCDLCGKEDKGMPYVCNPCGFFIHRRCTNFPGRLKVVRHNHPLNLIHSLELHQSNSQLCQLCFLKLDTNYALYYCSTCHFAAHLDCAMSRGNMEDINLLELKEEESAESKAMLENVDSKLDQSVDSEICKVIKTTVEEDGTEIATEIKHFSHEHHLKLSDEVPNNKICDGCVRAILTPSFYSCVESNCSFFLHISCTKLPKIKRHPLHQHPLTLTYQRRYFKCSVCEQWCNGFRYSCQGCYFQLDAQCSLISDTLTHACHEHPLYLSITNYAQKCSICGTERYQVFRCTTCEFVLDFKCATLPQTSVKNFSDDERNMEDINLLELKEEESAESKAMLENVDSKLDQSVDSEICKVIKTAVGEDGTEIASEIKHFSHVHHLKLTDEVPNNKICNGCVRAILTPSFYSCVNFNCSFFLHISCAKLPKIKQHHLHQHPLTLTYSKYGYTCQACWQRCNGLYYNCDKCYFPLDVQCSLISNTLAHACHEHPLYLSITNYKQKCSICDSKEYQVFRCTTCEFVLDFKCAILPQTAWCYQHEHPFTLCFTPEDDSGEYYCDICEEERDPKQWFYYCEDCSYPAHFKCIIREDPNVKLQI